jgi:transcription-repair coupling factor (superfamily II helicase)
MTLYKRIALIRNQYDADDISDELLDRFGELPRPVENLLQVALLRSQASALGIRQVTELQGEVRFYQNELDIPLWQEMSFIMGGRIRVMMGSVGESFVTLRLTNGEDALTIVNKMFEKYLETVQNEDKNSEQL